MAVVGADLHFEASGLDEFEKWLAHAEASSADMTEPLTDTRDHIQMMIFEEFISEGARSGGWLPLDDRYWTWKLNHGGGTDILKLPVPLLHGNPGTPYDQRIEVVLLDDASWDITATDAVFEPDSERAAWHQSGAARSRGGILPARPMLVFLETDYEAINENFERWMAEEVIGEGGITPFFGLGYKRYMGGFF